MRWFRKRTRVKLSRLAVAIDRIATQDNPRDPAGLVALVDILRPRRANDAARVTASLTELTNLLLADPARAVVLRACLVSLTEKRQHRYLYTDTGIVSAEGLRRGTLSRLSAKWLPQAPHDGYLRDLFKELFRRPDDYVWVQAAPQDVWAALWAAVWTPPVGIGDTSGNSDEEATVLDAIDAEFDDATGIVVASVTRASTATTSGAPTSSVESPVRSPPAQTTSAGPPVADPIQAASLYWQCEIGEAINILATRLYAAATNNEVVRLHNDGPYDLVSFDRLTARARVYRDALKSGSTADLASAQPLLMSAIAECERELTTWRKLLRTRGTTTSLSQQMLADGQMLARLRALAQITAPQSASDRTQRALRLYKKLIEEQGRDQNVRDLWRRTNRMLAQQVTEHAGLIGEHYVAITRSAWFRMVRAASGAGLFVALMALVKQLIAALELPPLWNALAISINYATGFVVVHLLNLAIATKQPAMTAALIASTVQSTPSGKRSLSKLSALIIAIVRTQFIAIACNVSIALPVGMLLHHLMTLLAGPDWIPAARADHLLTDIDPIHSLALPHAAIAGLCLYLSGVLAGYYNNLSAVTQVPERLNRARWLRWVGLRRRGRIANYARDNLGSLVGNASLGFMLGMAGFVGFLTGLPIDVRHVTLSAANFGMGLSAIDAHGAEMIDWHQGLLLIGGILMIGMINLTVSFTMALWTAFSANGIRMRDGSRLWILIWRRLRKRPMSLLLP